MKRRTMLGALVLVAGAVACTKGNDEDAPTLDQPVAEDEPGVPDEPTTAPGGQQDGVFRFGQTVKYDDGSTLTVAAPVAFKRDQYASGGEGKKVLLKFKATFTNKSGAVFDPSLTNGAASAGGEEGDPVYQDGLDAPDNKVLPGKSVTWWMGYGLTTRKDLQLEVTMGFLDYPAVIFTEAS